MRETPTHDEPIGDIPSAYIGCFLLLAAGGAGIVIGILLVVLAFHLR
jgi:hypothetical protein